MIFILMWNIVLVNGSCCKNNKLINRLLVKSERKSPECSVCNENFIITLQATCGHIFCPMCAETILKEELKNCPTCMEVLSTNFYDYLPTISPLISKTKFTTEKLQLVLPILCGFSNVKTIDKLWTEKIDVNKKGFCNLFPIHSAQTKEMCAYLLKKGAKIDQPSIFRDANALWLNSARDNLNLVVFFVENGVNVNAENSEGITAITIASYKGYLSVVKYLAENGADLTKTSKLGHFPLFASCEIGHLLVVEYLLFEQKVPVDQANSMGVTPLIVSCHQGNIRVVKLLLENGATIDQTNDHGKTALWISCSVENLEIIEILVQSGAKIEKSDNFGITAKLVLAIMQKNFKIAKFLLSKNANAENAKLFLKENEKFDEMKMLDLLEIEIDEEDHMMDNVNEKEKDAYGNQEEEKIEMGTMKYKFIKF